MDERERAVKCLLIYLLCGVGGLDLNEVRNALEDQEIRRNSMISKEKADELFSNMDQGGTGNIDWDEFKRFFSTKRRPSAVNLGV